MKYNWRLAVSARRLKRPATEEGHGILPFPEIEMPQQSPTGWTFKYRNYFSSPAQHVRSLGGIENLWLIKIITTINLSMLTPLALCLFQNIVRDMLMRSPRHSGSVPERLFKSSR